MEKENKSNGIESENSSKITIEELRTVFEYASSQLNEDKRDEILAKLIEAGLAYIKYRDKLG